MRRATIDERVEVTKSMHACPSDRHSHGVDSDIFACALNVVCLLQLSLWLGLDAAVGKKRLQMVRVESMLPCRVSVTISARIALHAAWMWCGVDPRGIGVSGSGALVCVASFPTEFGLS